MKNPLDYVRPNILALEPYSTARDEYKGGDISVWLDANESPYQNGVNRYPDPHQHQLKAAISHLKGVPESMIFIGGAGSDEAIDLTFRIFCRPGIDNAVAITPSYGVYSVSAAVNDVELREVLLGPGFSLPVEQMLAAADGNTKLMWICSPNNPTANSFPAGDIVALADRFDGMVVVDEAYIDFSTAPTLLPEIGKRPNLIVLQTFSKAWGMASLRVGMAFAVSEVAALYARVKYPYNLNGPTQKRILEAITGVAYPPHLEEIIAERDRLAAGFEAFDCVEKVYPSDANFILVKVDDPDKLYDFLVAGGAIVRNRSRLPLCGGCLRITVGTPAENRRLLSLLADYEAGREPSASRSSDRRAVIERATSETSIRVEIDLDGDGSSSRIDSGLQFFDHMLWQIPHHAGVDLALECRGDLNVDEHHTMEDVAICLGETISAALGSKRGIDRYGFVLPMDESRAMVLIDFGGRAHFDWDVTFTREYVGDTPTEMYSHFFHALCSAMRCNLHIAARGDNNHHIIEGVFKAFARALRMAVRRDPFAYSLPSSKGVL